MNHQQTVEHRLKGAGARLRLVRGHARFTAPHVIDVNGSRLEADTLILDVGGRANIPAVPGLDRAAFLGSAGSARH